MSQLVQSRSFDGIRTMSRIAPASGPPRVIAVGPRSAARNATNSKSFGELIGAQ
jgi:hypothetical protein